VLLNQIQAEIARVKALSIVEVDIETDLLASSPAKQHIDSQFEFLRERENILVTLLTVHEDIEEKKTETESFTTIVEKAENIKADLARQKEMITTLSKGKNQNTDS